MRSTAVSIEIREASVFYGANRVLDRASLSAAGGEFVGLLGASGCGKTTLLRAIFGFVDLASGSIVVGGQDVTRLSPEKRNIAMVFQSYALWPHISLQQRVRSEPWAARLRDAQAIQFYISLAETRETAQAHLAAWSDGPGGCCAATRSDPPRS